MNISYFRKSERTVAEVAEKLREEIKKRGFTALGELPIDEKNPGKGFMIAFAKREWLAAVAESDHKVFALAPTAFLVLEKDGGTLVGVGNPELLMGSEAAHALEGAVREMDRTVKEAVNGAAGVGAPKVEKLTLYSTATCPYCRMEKEYLEKNKVAFDLVMVDEDRKAAEEMVKKSGQMGVPQTVVRFDDGDEEVIVGFDRARLAELAGIKG